MIDQLQVITGRPVSRETTGRLEAYGTLLTEENTRQNLISGSSVANLWTRHLLDSAQLIRLARSDTNWLDIGTGAGLPGVVLAILGVGHITLVEPRRLRTDFLLRCASKLELANVTVITGKVEQLQGPFDVITARAVAPLERLFAIACHLTERESRWVLPKGRSAQKELAEAQRTWQGTFRLEASMTDPEARILVASGVQRKAGRG